MIHQECCRFLLALLFMPDQPTNDHANWHCPLEYRPECLGRVILLTPFIIIRRPNSKAANTPENEGPANANQCANHASYYPPRDPFSFQINFLTPQSVGTSALFDASLLARTNTPI